MKRKLVLSVLLLFIIISTAFIALKKEEEDEVHIHAAFHVYRDGKLFDFADFKYMHIMPCNEDEEQHKDDPLDRAHLHDLNGEIVHVHAHGVVWGDLFQNLSFSFNGPVTGYSNGEFIENILDKPIESYERVLLGEGEITYIEEKLEKLPSIDEIKEVEKLSESCGN